MLAPQSFNRAIAGRTIGAAPPVSTTHTSSATVWWPRSDRNAAIVDLPAPETPAKATTPSPKVTALACSGSSPRMWMNAPSTDPNRIARRSFSTIGRTGSMRMVPGAVSRKRPMAWGRMRISSVPRVSNQRRT